ncbi:hypothetical protein WJX79_005665 [Trebouxia sp. C0005]
MQPKARSTSAVDGGITPTRNCHRTPRQSRVSCSGTAEAALATEQQLIFQTASSTSDLQQAATLRAEAYYEEQPHARYVDSFKRQFIDQTGLGFQLLEAAAAFALEEWQAQAVYTTVDSANKAATNLYAKCGFEEAHSMQDSEGVKGRLTLLRATLPMMCNIE